MPVPSRFPPIALLAIAALLTPSPGSGQVVPDSAGARLEVAADASIGLQRLGGSTLTTLGGRLWLRFPAGWSLGVGGARGLHRVSGGELEGSGLEASYGAAAVSVAVPMPDVRGVEGLEARFAVGSGAVHLENALLGTTVDTETVWTLEPSLVWRGRTFGPVRVGGEAGYRWILGADGLSRLDAADLRTPTLSLLVSLPND